MDDEYWLEYDHVYDKVKSRNNSYGTYFARFFSNMPSLTQTTRDFADVMYRGTTEKQEVKRAKLY